MVRFQKFLHFSEFLFLKEYESVWSHVNFPCLKFTYRFWATLAGVPARTQQATAWHPPNQVRTGWVRLKVLTRKNRDERVCGERARGIWQCAATRVKSARYVPFLFQVGTVSAHLPVGCAGWAGGRRRAPLPQCCAAVSSHSVRSSQHRVLC